MSQENLDAVQRSFAEYNRGDVEGALEEWAPDAVAPSIDARIESVAFRPVVIHLHEANDLKPWEIRDGRVDKFVRYQSREEALEAARLSE
jgi:hypothetical protein